MTHNNMSTPQANPEPTSHKSSPELNHKTIYGLRKGMAEINNNIQSLVIMLGALVTKHK